MSRWKIKNTGLEEREHDYTATFELTNVDTDQVLIVTIKQNIPGPASDLIGALRATAQCLAKAAHGDDLPDCTVEKLN